jgi:hypothetical protein
LRYFVLVLIPFTAELSGMAIGRMSLTLRLAVLGFAALTACSPAMQSPPAAQASPDLQALASEALARFDRTTPTPPSCGTGWAESPTGYVVSVAPWAEQAGLRAGDQIVAVGGVETPDLEQRARAYYRVRAPGPLVLGVVRHGETTTLSLPCRHQAELFHAERRTLEAAARGDWDGCIAAAREAERLAGHSAYVTRVRAHACTRAKGPSMASPEGRDFATLHYELTLMLLRESRQVPGGTTNVRGTVLQMAEELRRFGFPEQASGVEAELQATLAHLPRLELTWKDNASTEDGFVVERKVGKAGKYLHLVNLPANTTSYVDWTVQHGTTYCYRVKAFTGASFSEPCEEACAVPRLSGSP